MKIPPSVNEVVLSYAPGSKEREDISAAIAKAKSDIRQLPMYINGRKIFTEKLIKVSPPHDHQHILGYINEGDKSHLQLAIDAAMAAKPQWERLSLYERAAIFLKAAALIAGPYRAEINAATMLGQSKNVYQAEIDSACELVDFLRFNATYAEEINKIQPLSPPGVWNQMEYRPLEGFVFALTPFNFTAIAGNLAAAPALMGNTIVWKPAYTQAYSANVIMEVFIKAGVPPGVINLIYADGPEAGEVIFNHRDFAGIHFTGSTQVFRKIWHTIGENIAKYKSYPRIVGETGGKDFVFADSTADPQIISTALIRGAFEYQGQKCSAASRAYLPIETWKEVRHYLLKDIKALSVGTPEDFGNFINAVIDERSFDKITTYISNALKHDGVELLVGGNSDKTKGYFIEPTIFVVQDPKYATMCEEIFGPVLTIYLYGVTETDQIFEVINDSPYALTGAIISNDIHTINKAKDALLHSAGNLYINDKPTGAVVGQQPFGGSRASGTNDKAGSMLNLLRWVSPRAIKENFIPPADYRYPFMQ